MPEIPPLQVLREENGYTVTEGQAVPNLRPRRWVALNPAQLGELMVRWAARTEKAQPFGPDKDDPAPSAAVPPGPSVTIQGDAFRSPQPPPAKPGGT